MKSLKPNKKWELETIEGLFAKKIKHNEIKNEVGEIKEWDIRSFGI